MKSGVRWFLISVLLLALILVPFVMFGEQFDRLGGSMMRGDLAGWPAAALVSSFLALDIILPVPSSIVSTGAGALFGFARGTAVIWVGMMAGAILGYFLGARATGTTRRFVGTDSLARAERVASDYGDWAIVICRPVPVLAEASVILAGLMHMPWRRFTRVDGDVQPRNCRSLRGYRRVFDECRLVPAHVRRGDRVAGADDASARWWLGGQTLAAAVRGQTRRLGPAD